MVGCGVETGELLKSADQARRKEVPSRHFRKPDSEPIVCQIVYRRKEAQNGKAAEPQTALARLKRTDGR